MSNLTLDGSTSFIGTEFIKLLATGSSDLATVQYVDDAIEQGGGGGNVDLSNYYTQTEIDALLNNKLNVNNPQDVLGNLRLDPTNGNSKLIINAVSPPTATDDFYCNGTGHFNGSLRVSVLTSDGDVNADGCNADTFNSHITTNDIVFKHNDVEYMRFNATDDEIQLSKNIDVGSSTLICNNFDSGLSDVVFNLNSSEYLRFQLSDGTVRVPNTKSFLSQNVFTDIVKPIAFSNDVSFQGQNTTDDGYEEYFKINSTTKALDFSKGISSIKCNDFNSNGDTDVVLKQNNIEFIRLKTNGNMEIKRLCSFISTLALDASGALSIFRNPAGGIETIDIKNNFGTGRHRFIIANNTILEMTTSLIQATRILQCDAGIRTNTINTATDTDLAIQRNNVEYLRLDTALDNIVCSKGIVSGGGFKCNTLDSDGDSNVLFKRNGSDYITFNTNKIELSKSLHLANELVIDAADKLTMRPSLEGGLNIFDIRNLHPVESNPMIRFRVGEGGGDTIVCEMRNEYLSMARNVIIGAGYELQTNIIDTNGDNDLVFQRNGTEIVKFNSSNEAEFSQDIKLNTIGQFVKWTNCFIREGITTTRPDFDICMNDVAGHMRFYVGSISDTYNIRFALTNNRVSCKVDLQAEDGITVFNGKDLKSNIINSNGNNDLLFQRNSITYFKLSLTNKIITVENDAGLSSPDLFANEFLNRTRQYDTVFWGSHPTADSRVEYMRWNYTAQQLDFSASIDATGYDITGNLINTGVSDKRLKTNIQDIDDANYSDCVKNVKLKTFEFKDKKFQNQDNYGMIAQDLLENLPKEFKSIVRQNIPKKDGSKEYLSINYMKLSVVLWGALQEQILKNEEKDYKIEHLEARLFEIEDIIKELKGKKTTKPKAKAKSKSKSEK